MTVLHKKLIRDLWRLRGQVVTVALVVASGIASYVAMRSSYESFAHAQTTYYTSYRFADIFARLKRAPNSIAAQIAAIPGVASVQTRVVVEVNLDVPGLEEPAQGRLVSIPERQTPILNDIHIRQGRYIEQGQRDEALVSEAFAIANGLRVGDTVGAVINGRWEPLRIVGIALSPEYVYEIRGVESFPDNKRFGVFWMSRDALGPSFNMEGAFNDVALSLAPSANETEVVARLDSILETYGGLGAYGREDQVSNRFLTNEIVHQRALGRFVPPIFLGVAAFLIHIVLSRLLHTQRAYIGLFKAFGYGNTAVAVHYLQFALAAVFLGTLAGAPVGIWMGRGLARIHEEYYRFPELLFAPTWQLIVSAAGISAAAACAGALSALRSVVALPPAEAMQPEAPSRFRPGIIERLGLLAYFSLVLRMMVRHLERRPWKAALSTFGLALASALLVVGLFIYDGITYLVQVEFETAARDDVSVVFNEPLGASARYALLNLPGVLRVEPFRAVPARLRFENRWHRAGILGLSDKRELRRLIDRDFRTVDLPPAGLLLSSSLAGLLGVVPGDTLTVEILEGRRPVRQIRVAGVLDDLIGTSAYMNVEALNRLMREGGTISGAYLAVDAAAASRLYASLKRTPAVSGVAVREAMLASFYSTIARSLNITTAALVAFACVIAFGIVYNNARISLSERTHELASLRVLGFTQREVGVMLLGEQGLLTAISIPAGILMGYGICAWLAYAMQSELYRMPLVISRHTYLMAATIVAAASVISGLLIYLRLRRVDLISALKTGE
jgi:putative ABC transport system permease protein